VHRRIFSVRTRFCSLDRAGAAAGFDRGQAEARADLQAGRPLLAAHSGRRGNFGLAARRAEPREVSLAQAAPGATALQGLAVALANKMARVASVLPAAAHVGRLSLRQLPKGSAMGGYG
jgi:hypothetical protein